MEVNEEKEIPEHLKSSFELWSKKLSVEQRDELERLLCKYPHLFSKGEFDIGRTNLIKHSIPLVDGTQPIKQRAYRHGAVQEKEIERQVEKLKEQDLIEEGQGAWSSPVVLVKKKDGSWRFCVDYRRLSSVTQRKMLTRYPGQMIVWMPWEGTGGFLPKIS
jgi:hypothetical protein